MLTRLRLENFKGWQDTGDIPLKPITAFFGANGSGKSSLLQALLLLKQTAESSDRGAVFDFGKNNDPADLGSLKAIAHRHNTANELKISLDWQAHEPLTLTEWDKTVAESEHIGFDVAVREDDFSPARPAVTRMAYRVGSTKLGMESIPGGDRYALFVDDADAQSTLSNKIERPNAFPRPVKCYGFPNQARAQLARVGLAADFELALEDCLQYVCYLDPIRAYPQRVYSWSGTHPVDVGLDGDLAVDAILASKERGDEIGQDKIRYNRTLERYIAGWLKDIGLAQDFKVVPVAKDRGLFEVRVLQHNYGTEALLPDVGFGVSQILPVLVLCFYAPPGSTVILEQPEIHLHPKAQSALADILIDAYQKRKVQIILESHSEHLLNRLQRRIAEEKIISDDVSLYFCSASDNGLDLATLELDQYGNIKNWPKNFFGDQFGEISAMRKAGLKRRMEGA